MNKRDLDGDHLQTIRLLVKKANEYKVTLWIAMVDYEKAFDSVAIWAVVNALNDSRIDERYITLLKYINKNATSQIMLEGKNK